MLHRLTFTLLLAGLVLAATGTARSADDAAIAHYSAKAKFENVIEDLRNAVTGHGLVIDHVSHVGAMLDRTGKDLGKTRKVFGPDQGQVFSFCSAVVSRQTMEADPANIVFCPYTIAVYSTVSDPATVHVSFRRPQRAGISPASMDALKAVEKLLDGIAREALGL